MDHFNNATGFHFGSETTTFSSCFVLIFFKKKYFQKPNQAQLQAHHLKVTQGTSPELNMVPIGNSHQVLYQTETSMKNEGCVASGHWSILSVGFYSEYSNMLYARGL